MDSKIGFEMRLFVDEAIRGRCASHDSNGNGLGDNWWTDKLIYFSVIYIDVKIVLPACPGDLQACPQKWTMVKDKCAGVRAPFTICSLVCA